jgi:multidrug efflux pump subunit AcrA (membrane-fusion protein)
MTRKKIWIGAGIVVVLAAIAYANFAFHRTTTTSITAEKIARHDLEAIVSASGKIQAKRQVNISAETVGKVVNLDVDEGDIVKIGQPLLQIDPRILQNTVESREASLATARAQLSQTRAQVDSTRVALQQSKDSFARQEGRSSRACSRVTSTTAGATTSRCARRISRPARSRSPRRSSASSRKKPAWRARATI